MDELHHMSAADALRAFRSRQLSPVELTEAVIARAERTEPVVNALCHRFFDEALRQAKQAERRYAGQDGPPRPLEGLPTVVKEDEPVTGHPWTQGSLRYRDVVAGHTSLFVRRLLDAGVIVHARSTASEFASAAFTHSALWGITRNPWNPEFSRAARRVARARRSPPGRRCWRRDRTPRARSGCPPRSAVWSGSSRRTAGYRWTRPITSTPTCTPVCWPAPSPTSH